MFTSVQNFFGATSEEPTDADARYWKVLKEGGDFAAHEAMLETLWKQEVYLQHMEMRSNVGGMGKDSVKERLEKQQSMQYGA